MCEVLVQWIYRLQFQFCVSEFIDIIWTKEDCSDVKISQNPYNKAIFRNPGIICWRHCTTALISRIGCLPVIKRIDLDYDRDRLTDQGGLVRDLWRVCLFWRATFPGLLTVQRDYREMGTLLDSGKWVHLIKKELNIAIFTTILLSIFISLKWFYVIWDRR